MHPELKSYRMPAEWERHQSTFISWPVKESMCFPADYQMVCAGYQEIIRAISEFEPVIVLANPDELGSIRDLLKGDQIEIIPINHEDAWLRDNGPTFLVDPQGNRAGVNWHFNAWGQKYQHWDLDDEVAPRILEYYNIRQFDAPFVLEGGSIHVDGQGTLLTTEECLLNPNRNKGMTKDKLELHFKKYLNVQKCIWLKKGLSGDETDGHVDNVACFAQPGKVLVQGCADTQDENYQIFRDNLEILNNAQDSSARKLEIIMIPSPPRIDYKGKRLTLSYINFYFVNGGIIMPVFGGIAAKTDKQAENIYKELFPDRKIRKVNGMSIIKEGGNIHCTTQQLPAIFHR